MKFKLLITMKSTIIALSLCFGLNLNAITLKDAIAQLLNIRAAKLTICKNLLIKNESLTEDIKQKLSDLDMQIGNCLESLEQNNLWDRFMHLDGKFTEIALRQASTLASGTKENIALSAEEFRLKAMHMWLNRFRPISS